MIDTFKGGVEMASQEKRRMISNNRFKKLAFSIIDDNLPIFEKDRSKYGILLCEGNENSMDVYLYSLIYPEFVVVPVGGCTNIRKLMPFMEKYFEYPTFGLIDRDNCSKNTIRDLEDFEKIYCTKLPFIENILCCPEVLKIIAKERGVEYEEIIRSIRIEFAKLLAEKISLLNPFNVGLSPDAEVQEITIEVKTDMGTIHKTIDLSNVMYTFRNKSIVGIVAYAMNFHGKDAYYRFLKRQIDGPKKDKVLQSLARHLPEIPYDEF